MNGFWGQIAALLLALAIFIALPVMVIWGWMRWAVRDKQWTRFSILSLVGFAFATMSGVLAMASVLYAHSIGGFPFYDPRLLRFFRWGSLLSATGIVFGLIGVWRPSSLRWHAPICGGGTLIFWVMAALGE
jgi:hypothetical protein